VHATQPLTSIEAFALALVEASSRLTATDDATAGEPTAHAAPPENDATAAID
jgi:hypothetical protein